MRVLIIGLVVAAFACATDPKPGTSTNESLTTTCTGDLYDGCTADAQCVSGLCKLYSNRGVEVCTQTCSATNPCPDQDGQAVVYNMGFCRPNAANACAVAK